MYERAPLTRDDLYRRAPSIFSNTRKETLSDRYRFIPTIEVVDALTNHGLVPVAASQSHDNFMFGISEYCGIFALWAIRQNGRNPTKPNLDRFARYLGEPLESTGYASNGEQFFRPKANMRSVITSKEGRLW